MNDYEPKIITPFGFYCQHILPLVYDESLSYYETLCRIQAKLNEVIKTQNDLQTAFQGLLDWVNTQLEAYAKGQLQEWLADGTLENIINQEIFGELNDRVTQNTNDISLNKTDIDTLEKRSKIVLPSGDVTGVQDSLNIQEALDNHTVVYLTKGDYYLNKALQFGIGYELHGVSQIDTKIHVLNDTSFIEGKSQGHDHIAVTNMIIQCSTGNKTNKCLNLYGNMTTPYNGARYSYFYNLWIDNFDIGIAFSGVWSTIVNRVRCSANNTSVSCLGSCNNLTFVDCEFMQGKTGVSLSPSGGSELYGIRIVRCNFEGNETVCVNAQGVIGLSIEDIYSEQTPMLFRINSCPNLVIKGGQVTGVSSFGSIEATAYTSAKFKNPRFTIKDLNIETNLNTDTTLSYIGSDITGSSVENVRILNLGSGNVKLLSGLSFTNFQKQLTTWKDREITSIKERINASIGTNDTCYLIQCYLYVSRQFTPTSTGTLSLRVKQSDNSYKTIGTLTLNRGQTYNVGQYLGFSLTDNAPQNSQQEIAFAFETSIGVSMYADVNIMSRTGNLFAQV